MIRTFFKLAAKPAAAAAVLLLGLGTAHAANEPKLLRQYEAWSAFVMNEGDEKVCFIVSDPKRKRLSRRGRNRGDVFFLVTHWPKEGTFGQPSVVIGYPFDENSKPEATIGSDTFTMVLDTETDDNRERAWLSDPAAERQLLDAMRRGLNMTVKGRSSSGTVSTDTYSLQGFTAALERIDSECK